MAPPASTRHRSRQRRACLKNWKDAPPTIRLQHRPIWLVADAVAFLVDEPPIPWRGPWRTFTLGVEPGVPVRHWRLLVIVLDPRHDDASATTTRCRRPGGEQQDFSAVGGHRYGIPPSVHRISAPLDLSASMASSLVCLRCQLARCSMFGAAAWRQRGRSDRRVVTREGDQETLLPSRP